MGLTIQIDSREKPKAITKIIKEFESQGVDYYVSKLWTGDYMSLDNPRLIIDRKQNLTEICSNVTSNHDRFKRELVRAQEHGIKLIILIEHSNQIKSIDDVAEKWVNPRLKEKKEFIADKLCVDENGEEYWTSGYWKVTKSKAMTGATLSKIMRTMEQKYDCKFLFCDKIHTGKKIIEILGGDKSDQGRIKSN